MKLFGKGGKLNVIDLLIILVLVAALVFVGYKLLGGGSVEVRDTSVPITHPNLRFTVLCEEVSPELAERVMAALEEDPREINGNMVEMTQIYYTDRLADGRFVDWYTVEKEEKVDLYLTIEAAADFSNGVYTVGGQEIRVAKAFITKSMNIEITGVIFSMEPLQ